MNGPTLVHPRFDAEQIAFALTESVTIEQNSGAHTFPAPTESWAALHSGVAANVLLLTGGESRESRRQRYTLAADGIEAVLEGWLDDVTVEMRLLWDGLYYDILAVSQVGTLPFTKIIAQRRAA